MILCRRKAAFADIVYIFLFIAYIAFLFHLTFFSHKYGRESIHHSINLIPFKTILRFSSGNLNSITVTNLLGNIAAFVPMGFFPPMILGRKMSFAKVLLTVLASTVLVETIQYFTGVGVADVDDVILNVMGGGIGYMIFILYNNTFYNNKQ